MNERPGLHNNMSRTTFQSYYYLKEELVDFCRRNHLPTCGSKNELNERIAHYLDTKEILDAKPASKKRLINHEITLTTLIEPDFVCSEIHRSFFKHMIGKEFKFSVAFQKWLKTNTGKTYADAIQAYEQIKKEKKTSKTTIDGQFEYNTYIRDFFEDNKGASLQQAIQCWKYKKSIKGHNRYEKSDLKVLNDQ